ncbi:MFS transporter [Arthrobacter sp. H5]|uniref:MFS transporter n=1 Tax=Arthrobacter sp. H5 TaxID=1267973 RepID=UPI000487DD76|nr:MFS transporter [Arthrobacter sp. H5]
MTIQGHHVISESGRSKRSFRFLLGTGAAEGFGDSLTRTVLPILAVATLGLGTAYVGVLNAIGLSAFLLLGMPIGMAVDRLRNPVIAMGTATLLRFGALAGLCVAWFGGWLSGTLLGCIAVLIGLADVLFTTAERTVIPGIIQPHKLKKAYSRLAMVDQSTSTAAAGTGSVLIALLGVPAALMASAASYAASRAFQFGVKVPQIHRTNAPRVSASNQFRNGFRTLRRNPAAWALTLSATLTNAGAMLGNTVLPVYSMRDLLIHPGAYAALGVLSAGGAILGAAAAPRMSEHLGLRTLRAGAALLPVPAVLLAVGCLWFPGPDLIWLSAQALTWSFLVSISAVAGAEVLPRSVDRSELATVGAAQRTISLGIMPVAAIVGGLAAGALGPLPLILVWGLLAGVAAIPVARCRDLANFY